MNRYLAITDVYAREILDSRGNPTIEVEVLAGDEFLGRAAVPSGASTGQYEAVELRDREERYGGLGVQRAVDHVNTKLAQAVIGLNVFDQAHLDQVLLTSHPEEIFPVVLRIRFLPAHQCDAQCDPEDVFFQFPTHLSH